jgi:hypothetical protein
VVVLVLLSCESLPSFRVVVSKVGWEEVEWGTYRCHNITTTMNDDIIVVHRLVATSRAVTWHTLHSVVLMWQALVPGDVAFLRCWGVRFVGGVR